MQKSMQKWLPDIGAVAGPKYLAIHAALVRDVEEGRLRPGDRLPPQRELAMALGVDLTTVTRAYSEARRLGLIDTGGRRGSFVCERGAGMAPVPQTAPYETGMNLPPLPIGSSLPARYATGIQAILGSAMAASRLQYQPAGGAPVDRQAGARWLTARGIEASEDNVLVVSGAQNALHAVATAMLGAGDGVCTGSFVYPGWLAIARRMGLRLMPLPCDESGIIPSALEAACAEGGVRALYIVPVNDNPTTLTTGAARRDELVAVARRHDLNIIEDDAYGPLVPAAPAPIAALAPERTWHVSGSSKIISPALRIAWLRAPSLRDAWRLAADVHETAIMAPPLNAALATRWLDDGTWDVLIGEVRAECVARQAIVAGILAPDCYRADPQGYHLWIPLAPGMAVSELIGALRPTGLSVVAGEAMAVDPARAAPALRVSIGGGQDRDQLARGLTLLDALLNHRGRRGAPLV